MFQLGVVMDPIAEIKISKDSTFAMLLEAQRRGWTLYYMELSDLFLRDGCVYGRVRPLEVFRNPECWFSLGEEEERPLVELDVILMRKDPPFDLEYLYATYLLELVEAEGVLVVNRPASLRDMNEKLFISWFADLCPPTLVTRSPVKIRAFLKEHGEIVLKPLNAMGGRSIFYLREGDPNTSVILETMTDGGRRFIMAQKFLPEIRSGDKRILLVDGEPVPYALARIPAPEEIRGNLAAGGRAEGRPLSRRDREIALRVGRVLHERGVLFAGLDVIGDFLTEINVTSPTCIQELDQIYGLNIEGWLLDRIQSRLSC